MCWPRNAGRAKAASIGETWSVQLLCAPLLKSPVRWTRAFLDAQVACQQQQVGADETSARVLVVDVRVHDREVAKTPLHNSPNPCPSNQTFECQLESFGAGTYKALLNKTAQWYASASWNLC